MSICLSAVLMAAFITSAVLSDLAYMRQDRLFTHFILGAIITTLFVGLCQRGYELINWGILLVIPVYMILYYMASSNVTVRTEIPRNYDFQRGI